MEGVLKEAGHAALKVCYQVYHCLETDSMAAIHGDHIIPEGETEKLDRLDEVLKQLVVGQKFLTELDQEHLNMDCT